MLFLGGFFLVSLHVFDMHSVSIRGSLDECR